MRMPKYISPSSLAVFESNPLEYYQIYLSDTPKPRMAQTEPMSVGSAADAFIKNYLVKNLYDRVPAQFDLKTLFEKQVEEQHRDFAWKAGQNILNVYQQSGLLEKLLKELQRSIIEPKFEIDVYRDVAGVPIHGKPDLFYMSREGVHVIYDWKVNGYCGKAAPKKGWITIYPFQPIANNVLLEMYRGVMINNGQFMEDVDRVWATQLSFYAWMCGEEPGNPFVAGIEQFACDSKAKGGVEIQVVSHRSLISAEFQYSVRDRLARMWNGITTGHIFLDLSKDENDAKLEQMEEGRKRLLEHPLGAELLKEKQRRKW